MSLTKSEVVEFHYSGREKTVVQSNKLIEARYSLTIEQQRLLLIMISMIESNDVGFKSYKINLKDFSKMLNISPTTIYSRMQGITEDLLKKVLSIKQNDGNLLQLSWISSALYLKGEGAVILKFDPSLQTYLLQLKEQFTSAQLNVGMKFKSIYGLRIYLLLKQYVTLRKREFTIKELKQLLQIKGKSYDKYSNFKNRVLKSAKREINNVSDLKVDYEEIKENRRVIKVIFHIEKQPYQEEFFADSKLKEFISQKQVIDDKSNLRKELKSFNLSAKYIDRIIDSIKDIQTFNKILNSIKAGQEYIQQQESKQNRTINPAPIIKKSIIEGWKPKKEYVNTQNKENEAEIKKRKENHNLRKTKEGRVISDVLQDYFGEESYFKDYMSEMSIHSFTDTEIVLSVSYDYLKSHIETMRWNKFGKRKGIKTLIKEKYPNVKVCRLIVENLA